MAFFPDSPSSSVLATRRRKSLVAQAVMEKLQKVSLARHQMHREQEAQQAAAKQLAMRIAEVDAEMEELSSVLRELQGPMPPSTPAAEVEGELSRFHRVLSRRLASGESETATEPLIQESRQQKQRVVEETSLILYQRGNVQVRELHGLLRERGMEVSSAQRLSQILSESELFEADRLKGWALKEERPGFRRPGLSVSKTTPSGDGS